MRHILLTACVVLTTYVKSQQVPASVYLVAGQSNTDGRVSNSELPEDIKANGYHHCWWSYGSGTVSGEGKFQRFQPRVARNGGAELWGYDAVLYYLLDCHSTCEFYVIKESLGGTAIDTACVSNDNMYWNASDDYLSSTDAADKGGKSLLKAFTENIGACMDAHLSKLENGYDIKAFFWHQGESDKTAANHYHDNLKALVQYVRHFLVYKTGDEKYLRLPFICGTFSQNSRDFSPQIVSALYDLQREDPACHVVDISEGSLQTDQLHFDAKGAELLGRLMYSKLTEILSSE